MRSRRYRKLASAACAPAGRLGVPTRSSGPVALGVSPAASVMTPAPHGSGTNALVAGNVCAAAGAAQATPTSDATSHALPDCDKFHPPVLGAARARAIGRD